MTASVLIPSYNHAPFVERCVKSIIKQTLKPKKLLVIDDGSRDDSPKIIERILQNAPFETELIVRENRGLCATLNEGFAKLDGEFFAYLGSDDVWLPTFLAERAKLLSERKEAVLAHGNAIFADENDNIFDCSAEWFNYPDGDARPALLQGIAPISSTVFYRRKALENVRWNEDSRLEDYEFYLQLCDQGEFAFDQQVLSVWRQHGYNVSRNMRLMLDEVLLAQKRNIAHLDLDELALIEAQKKVKFRYAKDFLQRGHKKDALKLGFENLKGANSVNELLQFSARLILPFSVVKLRRKLWRKKIQQKYGAKLEIH